MKITMAKLGLYELRNAINGLGELKGIKFADGIIKVEDIISKEIVVMDKVGKANEAFSKYDADRNTLCIEFTKKNKNGSPMLRINPDGSHEYDIDDTKMDEFNKKLEELNTVNKDVIEERKQQLKEFNDYLKEEITIDIVQIDMANVPKDISVSQLKSIKKLIKDE
jgi:hypothetical protein